MIRLRRLAPIAFIALTLVACPDKKPEPPKPAEPVKPPPPPAPPPPAEERAERECAAPLDPGPETAVTVAGKAAKSQGFRLSFADKDADGQLVLGVLGPVNEDSGMNMLALKKYLKYFQDEKADAILVTGDVGEVADGIARVLKAAAEAKLPVLVLPGNRECRAEYTDGVNAAKKDSQAVVNLAEHRVVEFDGLTLVSLPGYHDPNYINCATGCRYFKSTVEDVIKAAKDAKTPVMLVSHGPPRGNSKLALDAATPGENVGDPEINRAIQQGNIAFGVFSNIKEAGGRATTDAAGSSLIKEGAASKSLFLAAGPADTVPWEMNDGTRSLGMASVVVIKGGEASFKNFRAKAPTAAEKAEAKKLDPQPREDKAEPEAAPTPAPGAPPAPPPGQPAPAPQGN